MGDWRPQIGDLIGGRWLVIRLDAAVWVDRNHGSCYVREVGTNTLASCILEVLNPVPTFTEWLKSYAVFLKALSLPSMPRFIDSGRHGRCIYLCTSPVGPCVWQLQDALPAVAGRRFSVYTCLHIGFESLKVLRDFHDAGFLFRYVTPATFCVIPSSRRPLILFHSHLWEPRPLRALDDGSVIPARPQAPLRGYWVHISARAARGKEQTRLDDVWGWFYALVQFTTGTLPWNETEVVNSHIGGGISWSTTLKEECNEHPEKLLKSSPPEYFEILSYLKSTAPDHEPDYNRLMQLLQNLMIRVADENGGEPTLDWEEGGLYYDDLRHVMLIE